MEKNAVSNPANWAKILDQDPNLMYLDPLIESDADSGFESALQCTYLCGSMSLIYTIFNNSC